MKSDKRMPVEGINQTEGVHGTNDYDNSISVGSVGIEGGGDNGASTLRLLRKKHNATVAKESIVSKKPML